jgi:hypothetical protein
MLSTVPLFVRLEIASASSAHWWVVRVVHKTQNLYLECKVQFFALVLLLLACCSFWLWNSIFFYICILQCTVIFRRPLLHNFLLMARTEGSWRSVCRAWRATSTTAPWMWPPSRSCVEDGCRRSMRECPRRRLITGAWGMMTFFWVADSVRWGFFYYDADPEFYMVNFCLNVQADSCLF